MRRSFYRYGAARSISIGGQIAAGPAILTLAKNLSELNFAPTPRRGAVGGP